MNIKCYFVWQLQWKVTLLYFCTFWFAVMYLIFMFCFLFDIVFFFICYCVFFLFFCCVFHFAGVFTDLHFLFLFLLFFYFLFLFYLLSHFLSFYMWNVHCLVLKKQQIVSKTASLSSLFLYWLCRCELLIWSFPLISVREYILNSFTLNSQSFWK